MRCFLCLSTLLLLLFILLQDSLRKLDEWTDISRLPKYLQVQEQSMMTELLLTSYRTISTCLMRIGATMKRFLNRFTAFLSMTRLFRATSRHRLMFLFPQVSCSQGVELETCSSANESATFLSSCFTCDLVLIAALNSPSSTFKSKEPATLLLVLGRLGTTAAFPFLLLLRTTMKLAGQRRGSGQSCSSRRSQMRSRWYRADVTINACG